MRARITPLILTFNEAPNIGRVLDRLGWAKRVVIVDSCSDDDTESIAKGYPNSAFVRNRFGGHAEQWNFGLLETGIDTEWVLALDADYVLPDAFVQEILALNPQDDIAGYSAGFRYCIDGTPLRGTVYPPVTVLFRREKAIYRQDGHTQRLQLDGMAAKLSTAILHDDRKPLERWFRSQINYMKLEAKSLLGEPLRSLSLADRIRRLIFVAPIAMPIYCLLVKRTLLDGMPGLVYAGQRAIAELILSLFLVEEMLKARMMAPR